MGGARRRIPQDRARATTLPPPEGESIASAAAAIAGGRGCGGIGWRAGRSRFFAFSLLLFIFPLFFLSSSSSSPSSSPSCWVSHFRYPFRRLVASFGRHVTCRAGATAMEAIRRLRFPFRLRLPVWVRLGYIVVLLMATHFYNISCHS